jgi:Ran-binding protein 9/10
MEGGAHNEPHAESELPLWYDTVDEEDLKEQIPTELNTSSHPRYLAANKDKLTIRYVGKGNHTHDVGAIRTNRACPHRRLLYYFEMTVVDAGSRGCIAIGLADASFELNRQPGWEPNSCASHREDGQG